VTSVYFYNNILSEK